MQLEPLFQYQLQLEEFSSGLNIQYKHQLSVGQKNIATLGQAGYVWSFLAFSSEVPWSISSSANPVPLQAEIEFLFDGLDVNQIDYLYEALDRQVSQSDGGWIWLTQGVYRCFSSVDMFLQYC